MAKTENRIQYRDDPAWKRAERLLLYQKASTLLQKARRDVGTAWRLIEEAQLLLAKDK